MEDILIWNMIKKKLGVLMNKIIKYPFLAFTVLLLLIIISCNNEDNGLASYTGSPMLSNIIVEAGSFKPNITWLGGYASIIGVNIGSKASLDSTLIYLVKTNGNTLKFPIKFGTIPDGAVNLIDNYNGKMVDSLSEDNLYTYWIMKEDVWNKISSNVNCQFIADQNLEPGEITTVADTLTKISAYSFTVKSQFIDVFVNIKDLKYFGRLGEVTVHQPTEAGPPIVTWKIKQVGVTDTAISAIGLVAGQQYDEKFIVWDLWSVEETPDGKVYGKKNVINAPIRLGDLLPGTFTFKELPLTGIERNKDYYIWIANQNWTGTRSRVANYYAYATFRTW